jgi:hypothetical protein
MKLKKNPTPSKQSSTRINIILYWQTLCSELHFLRIENRVFIGKNRNQEMSLIEKRRCGFSSIKLSRVCHFQSKISAEFDLCKFTNATS